MARYLDLCAWIEAVEAFFVKERKPAVLELDQPERYEFTDNLVDELSRRYCQGLWYKLLMRHASARPFGGRIT